MFNFNVYFWHIWLNVFNIFSGQFLKVDVLLSPLYKLCQSKPDYQTSRGHNVACQSKDIYMQFYVMKVTFFVRGVNKA